MFVTNATNVAKSSVLGAIVWCSIIAPAVLVQAYYSWKRNRVASVQNATRFCVLEKIVWFITLVIVREMKIISRVL